MSQCPHGERVRREGTSAKGPWVGWFCPLRKGDPEQCKPEFDKSTKTPAQKFSAALDASASAMQQGKKDDVITSLAIIKELIALGKNPAEVQTVKEFFQWKRLAEGKTLEIKEKDPAKVGYGADDDVRTEDIPF